MCKLSSILSFLILILVSSAHAQSEQLMLQQACSGTFMLCGLNDPKTKGIIVPHIYERVFSFSDGLALVIKNNRYGYIDNNGNEVIPPQYDNAFRFSGGFARVAQNGLYTFIDKTGTEITSPKYDMVFEFSDGLARVVKGDLYGFVDKTGEEVIPVQYTLPKEYCTPDFPYRSRSCHILRAPDTIADEDETVRISHSDFKNGMAIISEDDKEGVIDRKGNRIIATQFKKIVPFTADIIFVTQINNSYPNPDCMGLYSIKSGWLTNSKLVGSVSDYLRPDLIWASGCGSRLQGLLKPDGTWKIEPIMDMVQGFYDERAIICTGKTSGQESRCGAIDPDGNIAVPLNTYFLHYWINGFGRVRKNGKEGFIDKSGNILGGRLFVEVKRNKAGDVERVLLEDGNWVGLNRQGKIVTDPLENKIIASCPSGVKLVLKSGKIQVQDADNKPTIPLLFEHNYNELYCDRPSPINVAEKKWNFIALDGHLLSEEGFDNIGGFNSGYAAVMRDDLWGIINAQGQFTVRPRYKRLTSHRSGIFRAESEHHINWINGEGEEQPEPVHDSPDQRATFLKCKGGGTIFPKIVRNTRLWGLADAEGKIVITPKYRAISCPENGTVMVPVDAQKQWCPVGADNNVRGKKCIEQYSPITLSHHSPEKFSDDPYESSVLWSRAQLDYAIGERAEHPKLIGGRYVRCFTQDLI